jgi:hypothetical protein
MCKVGCIIGVIKMQGRLMMMRGRVMMGDDEGKWIKEKMQE